MTRTKAEKAAIARDGANCLRCGRPLYYYPASVHHRLRRSAGTKEQVDRLANLTTVCGSGTTGCHREIHNHPTESYATGWLIRRGDDTPDQIPLTDLAGRRFFLTDDGTVIYVYGDPHDAA
jgi:5-methylcytosine-specific restriction endonuclease McrA